MFNPIFFKDKTVLITGHTGFKGSWLTKMLVMFGAKVIGYSLEPETDPNLFELSKNRNSIISVINDIRDFDNLHKTFLKYRPEIVIHLAAQPIVLDSYNRPRYTYDVNVMGTVNVLECCRLCNSVKSVLNVTTDKVYLNQEDYNHAFKEDESLDGFDPYSNSKSCSELVTHSYIKSFFDNSNVSVSTARAGNVIGGGDFANNRIIPDCVRSIMNKTQIIVRNPNSTRPYQHVLEPLSVYLTIIQKQYEDKRYQGFYNVGPDDSDCVTTGQLVAIFAKKFGNNFSYIYSLASISDQHEAAYLKLDSSKIKNVFGYKPRWHIDSAIEKVIEWTKVFLTNKDSIPNEMEKEISEFLK